MLRWSAPLSRKQTWPFYLSITWLLLHKEFFSLLYFSDHHHGPLLSSLTLSSLVLLCSFSLIDFLLAFSLACPLGHICSFSKANTCGLGEEELVSCFLYIGHTVPGALHWSFLSSGSTKAQRGFNFFSRTALDTCMFHTVNSWAFVTRKCDCVIEGTHMSIM